jgi:hypothetical protein
VVEKNEEGSPESGQEWGATQGRAGGTGEHLTVAECRSGRVEWCLEEYRCGLRNAVVGLRNAVPAGGMAVQAKLEAA